MPYLVSFLAGVVSWNIFDKTTENKTSNGLLDLASNVVLLYLAYQVGKKLLKGK